MADSNINPMQNLYNSFLSILDNLTIKYAYLAEKNETLETKQKADEYLIALQKKDTFLSYNDYTETEYENVGITDYSIIRDGLAGMVRSIPEKYRESLLLLRRDRVLNSFEEENNYYRELNGYPNIEDKDYFYITKDMADEYGIDNTIPIHKIQDYYNNIHTGDGDYYISLVEGSGYLDTLINANSDKVYLKYIGSNRISIMDARYAKNFQVIQLKHGSIKFVVYDQFMQVYEQCREYFVKTTFVSTFRSFIDYYDNFIAMCIMIMTIQQLIMKQISLGVQRAFFDIFAIKALYQAYNIPYNLCLDEETQNDIMQNLNLLVQNKATNKVVYDIASILGFSNINVYKYYLSKERKFDIYGVPIVAWTKKFNNDTGEIDTVPDYEKMYDIYFQKADLKSEDFITSFMDDVNKVKYEEVTQGDPFWWEDQNLYDRIWQTEYNFVESKYLSLGISYSLTDMMFENIVLMKMIIEKEDELDDLRITLPKILENTEVPLFDVIILLICLTASKHHLNGEIITIPTQVISVLDYMTNVESGSDMLVDTFSFNFDYFLPSNTEGQKQIRSLKELLGEEDAATFMNYISVLSFNGCHSVDEKISTINEMYSNIKNLYTFLEYKMTETTDRKVYEALKTMYRAAFYSKEVKDTFTITGDTTGFKRTAWTYFEYLYYKNPKLYKQVFTVDFKSTYAQYLLDNNLKESEFTYDEYIVKMELGEIVVDFANLKEDIVDDITVRDEKIYYYVNHIISRVQMIIDNLQYIYLLNDTVTPLEDLLVKLVRFFKSYTVDMIGLDTILVCDLKPENLLRLFDEIYYMEKTIQMDERIKMSYSDVIHHIISTIRLKDNFSLKDKLFYDVYLYIDDLYEWACNDIKLKDKISYVSSNIDVDGALRIYDICHVSSTLPLNEDMKLKDHISKIWYE